jgi:hypothetical protein
MTYDSALFTDAQATWHVVTDFAFITVSLYVLAAVRYGLRLNYVLLPAAAGACCMLLNELDLISVVRGSQK